MDNEIDELDVLFNYINERWVDVDTNKIDNSDAIEYALWMFENDSLSWEEITNDLDYSQICESIHSNDYEKLCQIDRLEKDYCSVMKADLIKAINGVQYFVNKRKNDFDQNEETKAEIISHNKERLMNE